MTDPGFGELRSGSLGVRLCATEGELAAAQRLRFRVFHQEMGATPAPRVLAERRDHDPYDAVAHHLLVVDHARDGDTRDGARVVGTYRLIQQGAADRVGGFYSAAEYDLSAIAAFPGRVLELGRSCVDSGYRGRSVMQLLWQGIAAYVFRHRIDLMFGCASLPGTDPDALAPELSYLHRHHLAPPALRPRALAARHVEMRRLDADGGPGDGITPGGPRIMAGLPPLVKGYLRLGGFVGDGAVIDRQFNTIDVAVVVKTDLITGKYYRHYERQSRGILRET